MKGNKLYDLDLWLTRFFVVGAISIPFLAPHFDLIKISSNEQGIIGFSFFFLLEKKDTDGGIPSDKHSDVQMRSLLRSSLQYF